MSVIDKNMYSNIKNWCDRCEKFRPQNQNIMYVNSHDRALTNATIKKMMFEVSEEDIHGEVYIAFYSAENFYHDMRRYYSEISKLYMCEPDEKDTLVNIINNLPPTCGWIILIVEDVEALSEDGEKLQEMLETIKAFASKRSSIILIGDGDCNDVFSECSDVLNEVLNDGSPENGFHQPVIGLYNQDLSPDKENVVFKSIDKERDELNYYWEILYEQLENKYFDFEEFKTLYKDTMSFIIPRVTKQKIFRKDLTLIENIGLIRNKEYKNVEVAKPWELDAARNFAGGLHYCILNKYGHNDDISLEKIGVDVVIEEREEHYGTIHISGAIYPTIEVSIEDVCANLDKLSETIHECTYNGNKSQVYKYLREIHNKNLGEDESSNSIEQVGNKVNALMDGIKEAADKTINNNPGKKVRRYRDDQNEKNE